MTKIRKESDEKNLRRLNEAGECLVRSNLYSCCDHLINQQSY